VVALGGIAFDAATDALGRLKGTSLKPRPRFAHGARVETGGITLLGSYHPSQQNTFTGRLTMPMLVDIFDRARELADGP
jgi:uracil-DNA glycosylase